MIRIVAVVVTAAALALGSWVTVAAVRAVGRPWPGFAMLAEGTVAPLTLLPVRTAAAVDGLNYLDRVIAVDGEPVATVADVRRRVEAVPTGTPLTYRVRRVGGSMTEVTVPTTVLTARDVVEACVPFVVGALLGLGLGLVPVLARPDLVLARLFFVMNMGLAVDIAFRLIDAYAAQAYPRLGWPTTTIWTGAFLHLAFLNPVRREPLKSHPRVTVAAIYGLAGVAAVLNIRLGWHVATTGVMALATVLWVANLIATVTRAPDLRLRLQARLLLGGTIPIVIAASVLGASATGVVSARLPLVAYLLPLWAFGAVLGYAVIEHNLFEVDAMVRRTLAVGLLAFAGLGAYAGLSTLFQYWLDPAAAWAAAGVTVVLLLTLVPVVGPLRRRLEDVIERVFFPRQREARTAIHAASRELVTLREEDEVARFLRDTVARTMADAALRLLAGRRGEPLVEIGVATGASGLRLPPDDRLCALAQRGATVSIERLAAEPRRGPSRAAVERASELGVSLVVPLPASAVVAGALLLGPRTDGRLFTRDDEILLETLAAQAAATLENARAWDAVRDLERRLKAENVYLRQEVQMAHDADGIIGRSPALRAALAQVEQVAPTDATVLVVGETGTGKELVVRALHARSRRRTRTLVKVACAALPEPLLESELFGHERGAFTGAATRKPGRFEVADGGTLFLDDVDTLPVGVQAKLLRALQEGEVQRLGSNELRKVDVRVVAATNRDLLAEVRAGRFREDLYYRLNVVPIRLPALRERREDIAVLVEHFVQVDGPKLGRQVEQVAAEAMAALEAHDWPGNVRELRNVVQRALVLSTGDVLRLAGPLGTADGASAAACSGLAAALADQVRDLKIRLIREALDASGGNQRIAAERLGLHRQSLTRMIRDLGLQSPDRRAAPEERAR